MGVDTVKNLAVDLVLFVVVGAVCGALWARVTGKSGAAETIVSGEGEPEAGGEA